MVLSAVPCAVWHVTAGGAPRVGGIVFLSAWYQACALTLCCWADREKVSHSGARSASSRQCGELLCL